MTDKNPPYTAEFSYALLADIFKTLDFPDLWYFVGSGFLPLRGFFV